MALDGQVQVAFAEAPGHKLSVPLQLSPAVKAEYFDVSPAATAHLLQHGVKCRVFTSEGGHIHLSCGCCRLPTSIAWFVPLRPDCMAPCCMSTATVGRGQTVRAAAVQNVEPFNLFKFIKSPMGLMAVGMVFVRTLPVGLQTHHKR